jgi:hypothetical protein
MREGRRNFATMNVDSFLHLTKFMIYEKLIAMYVFYIKFRFLSTFNVLPARPQLVLPFRNK